MADYEIVFLSDLLKKSRITPHPDFILAIDYIYSRLEKIGGDTPSSQFNSRIRLIKKILPRFFLPKLLYCFRYDAMMAICETEEKREVYGMISFQKHPTKSMIGMFDVYISENRRSADFVSNSKKIFGFIYNLTKRFKKSGYCYIQCGYNETTRKLLQLYQRISKRNNWDQVVDPEKSRIYLKA